MGNLGGRQRRCNKSIAFLRHARGVAWIRSASCNEPSTGMISMSRDDRSRGGQVDADVSELPTHMDLGDHANVYSLPQSGQTRRKHRLDGCPATTVGGSQFMDALRGDGPPRARLPGPIARAGSLPRSGDRRRVRVAQWHAFPGGRSREAMCGAATGCGIKS